MILPFDRVILTSEIPPRELSVEQFLKLPLDRRIGYVLARAVEFWNGDARVERRVALASLQQQAARV